MLSLSDLIHDLSDSEDEPDRSTLMVRLAAGDRPAIEGMGSSRVPLQSSAERCETDPAQGQRAGQQDWGLSSVTRSPWHEEYGSYYEPASDGSNGGDGAGGEVDLLEHGHAELAGQHHEHSDHLMQSSPHEQLTSMMAYGDAYANATAYGRISLPLPPPTPPPRSPRPRGPRRAEPEPRSSPLSATVSVDGPLGRIEQSTRSMSIQDEALETLKSDDCHDSLLQFIAAGRDGSVDSSTAPSTPRNRKRSITTEPSTPSDAPSPQPAVTAHMTRSLSDLYDESEHDDVALQVAETGKEVESFAERMVAFVYNDTDGDGSATLAGVITPLKKRISGLFLGLSSYKGDENAMIHQVDDQKALGKSESGTHVDKPDMPAIVAQIVPSKADPSVIVRAHASRDGAEGGAVPSEVGSELMVDDDTTMAHLVVQDMVDAERAVSASVDEGPEDDAQDVEPEECARIRDDLPAPSTSSSPTTLIPSWTENTVEVRFGDPEYPDSANASDQEVSPQEEPIAFHDEKKAVDVEPEQSSELPISVDEEDEEDRQQNISTPDLEATAQLDPPSNSPAPAPQNETRLALELPAMKDKSNDSEAEAEVAQEFAVGTLVDEVEPHAEAAPESEETAQMEHAEDPIVEGSHATIIDEVLSEAIETMRIQRESRSHEPQLDSSEDLPVFEEADAIGDEEDEVIDDEVGEGEYVTHRSPRGIDERSEMRSADLYSVPSSPLARFTSEASDDSLQRDEVSDDGSQRNEASDDGEQREDPFIPPRGATPVVVAPPATSSPGLESPTPQHAPRPKPKPVPASKPTPRSASIPAQSFYVDVPALPRRRHSSMSEHAGSSRSSRQIESRRPLGPTDKSLESPIASIRAKNEARLFDDPPDLNEPGSREASVQSRSFSTRQLLGDSLEQSSPGPIPMDVELMEEHPVEVYQQVEAFDEAGLAADDVAPVPQSEQDNESDDVVELISPPRRQPRRIIVEEEIPPSSPLPSLPPLPSSIAPSGSIRPFDSPSKSPPVEHDRAPPSPGPSTRRQDGDSSSDGETLIMIPRARPRKKRKKASPAVKKKLPRPSIEPAREVSDESSADELDMLRTAKVRLSPIIGRKITLQSRHFTTPTTTEPYPPKTVTKTRNANPSYHRLSLPSRSVPALDRSNAKGYIIAPSRPHASMDNAPSSNGRPARTRKSTANWWELSKGLQRNEPLKTKRQRKEENDDDYESRRLDEGLEDDEVVRSSVTKRKSPSLSKRRRVSRVVDDDEED
ncbi:BZ3500_MvSof-1268-A1-R1_Chr3-1g05874 [Microbotryum saponariae]|uniref:BZ3500_MvSof-1268-A1-R1_Chr3-1g05874 protein n=1 Tax=Microbotryum saponariae TaxID=289078 RepID=A0A2X0LDM6_9BASI|nr:BZ3500_MvSof-1268-A1-R1_Chr3-1g05874 [Microbotryum saponariae]SDA05064.1 BZ3501_MvSof-1269-A2-R1_Chr3-1g05544 [Microbotryum saponariae]